MANIKDKDKLPLHPAQMEMIRRFILKPKLKFKDLKIKGLTTKHQTYHIKKLINLGLIYKSNDGVYQLTEKGLLFCRDIDVSSYTKPKKVEFSKRGVVLRAIRKTNKGYEWLFHKRLKQPYYGYVGFPSGKIHKLENPLQTAKREFKEETNLTMLHWELIKIEYNIAYFPNGNPKWDLYFYVFNIYATLGNLAEKSIEGEYFWATAEEFKHMQYFDGMFEDTTEASWLNMPKQYEKYKKLLKAGTWKNKPERFNKMQIFKTNFMIWPTIEQ